MTWNKKNQQFALSCNIRPSTKELAQWILRRTSDHQSTEKIIDLRECNAWVGKHRLQGSYDRKTVKEAMAQLDELTYGWITVVKSYSWAVRKIIVRPVSIAVANRSQKLGIAPKLPTGKPMFDADHKKRSRDLLLQNISRLDSLLQKIGIRCNQETLARMWRYSGKSMANVEDAVKYMLRVNQEKIERSRSFECLDGEGLTSPIGWLHDCLKHARHIQDEQAQLPAFDTIGALTSFVRDTFNGISPPKQLQYQT